MKCFSACIEMANTEVAKCPKAAKLSKRVIDLRKMHRLTMNYKNDVNVIQRQIDLASRDGDMHFVFC